MTDKIKFAILSFAHPHAHAWASAINEHLDAELIGVWDSDPERGRSAAERHATRFFAVLEELLPLSDAVGITSETSRHQELVTAAARHGVHVLCEKPMATTLEDCDLIADSVRESDIVFMQSFPKRFDPAGTELIDLVQSSVLGDVSLVRIRHAHHFGLDPSFATQWFAEPELSGGGALIDEGVHATDFLCRLLGRPTSVVASTSRAHLNLEVEDTAVATFTYDGGPLAEIVASWAMVAAESSIEVYGARGTAILSGVDVASKQHAGQPYLKYWHRDLGGNGFAGSAVVPSFLSGDFHSEVPRRFISALQSGETPASGLREGRESLELVLTSYESARLGQRVEL
ncbi:MAG: Gfo/Idh/MocA family oxidoreductase [Thermomicrobiales bacterium]|nr:Gfo/Idh/MocA family oxidoreductase [Thermomicrobiales bacterium]